MDQLNIPEIAEARQGLIKRLREALDAKERRKADLTREIRLLKKDLRKELRGAGEVVTAQK